MINVTQLRKHVVVPTLKFLKEYTGLPYSKAAEELLLMTAAHESHLGTYLRQVGVPDGIGAYGIYQMEIPTLDDIHCNFLAYRPHLSDAVLQLTTAGLSDEHAICSNLAYATAMARIHYFRVPEALPDHTDIKGLAAYAKKHYNTELGKATEEDYYNAYMKYVRGENV